MVQKAEIPLADVIRMVSETPARIMGVLDRKGTLERGKDADIIALDRDACILTNPGTIVIPRASITVAPITARSLLVTSNIFPSQINTEPSFSQPCGVKLYQAVDVCEGLMQEPDSPILGLHIEVFFRHKSIPNRLSASLAG